MQVASCLEGEHLCSCVADQEGHANGETDEEISWDIDVSAEGDDPAEGAPADIDWDASLAPSSDASVQKAEWFIELDADETRPTAAPATEQGMPLLATSCAVLCLACRCLDHGLVLSPCQPAEGLSADLHKRLVRPCKFSKPDRDRCSQPAIKR